MKDKLDMFEFGTYEQAMARSGGKPPTTTKWVEGWKTGGRWEQVRQEPIGGEGLQGRGQGSG